MYIKSSLQVGCFSNITIINNLWLMQENEVPMQWDTSKSCQNRRLPLPKSSIIPLYQHIQILPEGNLSHF